MFRFLSHLLRNSRPVHSDRERSSSSDGSSACGSDTTTGCENCESSRRCYGWQADGETNRKVTVTYLPYTMDWSIRPKLVYPTGKWRIISRTHNWSRLELEVTPQPGCLTDAFWAEERDLVFEEVYENSCTL